MKRLALPDGTASTFPYREATERLPAASVRVTAPAWSEGFVAEFAYCVKVAERFIADQGYPHVAMNCWLVLALVRRIDTLESQNEALRHFREEAAV